MSDNDLRLEEALEHFYWFDQQQAVYKEQMSSALIAFNAIENYVSEIIAMILKKLGRGDLVERQMKKAFMARVDALELLVLSLPGAPKIPYDRLAALAGTRNDFAHGHFTSDDDGSLIIKGKGKPKPWDPSIVFPFIKECTELRFELSGILSFVLFGSEPAEIAAELNRRLSEKDR